MLKFSLALLLFFCSQVAVFAEAKPGDLYGWWIIDDEFMKGIVAEMEKTADDKDKKMLTMFMPMVKKMMAKQTVIFTEKEMISVYGDRERKTAYTLKSVTDNTFAIEAKGRVQEFVLQDGRLVNKRELSGKRPAMYLRKLSDSEVGARKKLIELAKQPPAASEPADTRINFLVCAIDQRVVLIEV